MKCIDGVEGALRSVLTAFQRRYARQELDDTDFVQNIKTIIEGATDFLDQNREIGTDPELLRRVLYDFSRQWWVEYITQKQREDAREDDLEVSSSDDGYIEYYFDYIYECGSYPD